jgi:hypothetical protein
MSDAVVVSIISGIVALIGAFLMSLPGLKAFKSTREKEAAEIKKIDAEASKIYSEMADESALREKALRDDVASLRTEVFIMKQNVSELIIIFGDILDGVEILTKQLKDMEYAPKWELDRNKHERIREIIEKLSATIGD